MMLKKITSKDNKILKVIRSLKVKKSRDKENLFIVEGYKFIFDSLLYKPKYLVFSESAYDKVESYPNIVSELNKLLCDIILVPDEIFSTLTDTEMPQGALCVFEKNESNFYDYIKTRSIDEDISIIVCESLQDPGNCGTIIRTADAGGFTMCVFTENSVDIYNPKVVRSTAGSILNIPSFNVKDIKEVLKTLRVQKIQTYGTYLNTENYYDKVTYSSRSAIFIGNEANGLTSETVTTLDTLVKIPIIGKAESLNAGVATSIMIYEVLKQKNN